MIDLSEDDTNTRRRCERRRANEGREAANMPDDNTEDESKDTDSEQFEHERKSDEYYRVARRRIIVMLALAGLGLTPLAVNSAIYGNDYLGSAGRVFWSIVSTAMILACLALAFMAGKLQEGRFWWPKLKLLLTTVRSATKEFRDLAENKKNVNTTAEAGPNDIAADTEAILVQLGKLGARIAREAGEAEDTITRNIDVFHLRAKPGRPSFDSDIWARKLDEAGTPKREMREEWQRRREEEMTRKGKEFPVDWDDTFKKVFTTPKRERGNK
jgi:hypothetical protein